MPVACEGKYRYRHECGTGTGTPQAPAEDRYRYKGFGQQRPHPRTKALNQHKQASAVGFCGPLPFERYRGQTPSPHRPHLPINYHSLLYYHRCAYSVFSPSLPILDFSLFSLSLLREIFASSTYSVLADSAHSARQPKPLAFARSPSYGVAETAHQCFIAHNLRVYGEYNTTFTNTITYPYQVDSRLDSPPTLPRLPHTRANSS